jgi:thioredoxin reductase (NADPH)
VPAARRPAPAATVDCLIVGGGPAGLSAATQLGRLRRSCLIVDDEAGRSLWSQVTRNHLGFPDGVSASELRLLGQRQAVQYGAELRHGRVVRLQRHEADGGGFEAVIEPHRHGDDAVEDEAPGLEENRQRERRHAARLGERPARARETIRARTVIVAAGVVDAFPVFEGRDACVGVSLFWCIVCDGYEAIGRRVAVVGDDDDAIETAFGLLHFTDRVSLVTGRRRTRAPAERLAALEARGVEVRRAPVERYRHESGQIESLELAAAGRRARVDGDAPVSAEMVFVSAPKRSRSELATRLGAERDEEGYIVTDAEGQTSVPGLFAAGDVTAGHAHQVTTAAHQGATAATAVNYTLYDDVERGEG